MARAWTTTPRRCAEKGPFRALQGVLLVCLLALVPVHVVSASTRSSVLCAVDSTGSAQVWLSAEDGLVLVGWSAAPSERLLLGRAGFPRFLEDGRLVFEATVDDGHVVSATVTSVLDPGSLHPRAPRAGEPLGTWTPVPVAAPPAGVVRVCIDAGHGGSGTGALGNGLQEKDVTLDVAQRLADLLETDNGDASGGGDWEVLLTRVDDSDVTLAERVTMADAFAADSFVSLHGNKSADASDAGTETHAWAEGTVAAQLRDRVHSRMLQAWGLADRGTKTGRYYVLLNTRMPASLSEMGFLTSPTDAALLGDPDAREAMALAHLFALQEHHGFTIHQPSLFTILFGGTYGSFGKPSLIAKGPLTAGSTLSMKVVDAAPDAPAVLFFGFQSMPTPFLGGELYPFPAPHAVSLVIDSAGSAQGQGTWPAGIPAGTKTWYQLVVVDPQVPDHGATMSDALVSVSP